MKRNTVPANPKAPLRMLVEDNVQRIVAARGGVRRIIASDRYAAVLYASHLHPARLDEKRPGVVVECHSGEWFGLDPSTFTVGYSGGGPLSTSSVLQRIGVPVALADQIAHANYSDVHFDENGGIHGTPTIGSSSPRDLGAPDYVNGDWAVTLIVTSTTDLSRIQRWADYLEEPSLPWWINGARGARVFTDPQWAMNEGLSADEYRPITIAIRQGRLTLWIACPIPVGDRYLHENAYAVLDAFGFRFDTLRTHDARPAWWRWVARRLWTTPPSVVEARR